VASFGLTLANRGVIIGVVDIAELARYFEAGMQHIALRLTSWDQRGQLKRFLSEIAPAFGGG